MMGPKQDAQAARLYALLPEGHVPQDHLLRSIDRFVDLSGIRIYLAKFYSHTGRRSIDPELLIRMLLLFWHPVRALPVWGSPPEPRLPLVLPPLNDHIPDHSTFSKNRCGRFRESELLRHLFETTVARCIEEGLVSGQRMAVDASLPKFTSFSDPASQWTAARKGPAFFSYSDNHLIDTDHGVSWTSKRPAQSGKRRLGRRRQCWIVWPRGLTCIPNGSSPIPHTTPAPLLGWLVDEDIAPPIPVIEKAGRSDGTVASRL